MNLDLALLLASMLFTVLLAAVGVEMANNPPTSCKAKWIYRSSFIVLGILLIGATYWQGKRNIEEQNRIRAAALLEQKNSRGQYEGLKSQNDEIKGQLKTITNFAQHPPPGLSQEQIAAAVRTMAAPYGDLAKRCKELGDAIILSVEQRKKSRPDPITHRQEYGDWYRLNDGIFYRGQIRPYVTKLHQELAAVHIDDPRLDELIEKHEQYYASRQKADVNRVVAFPEAFHLSIEEIEEIGQRFKYLATRVPKS